MIRYSGITRMLGVYLCLRIKILFLLRQGCVFDGVGVYLGMTLNELSEHISKLDGFLKEYMGFVTNPREKSKTIIRANGETRRILLPKYKKYVDDNQIISTLAYEELPNNPFINGTIDDGVFTEKYFPIKFPKIIDILNKSREGMEKLVGKSENELDTDVPVNIFLKKELNVGIDESPNSFLGFLIISFNDTHIRGWKLEDMGKDSDRVLENIAITSIDKINTDT